MVMTCKCQTMKFFTLIMLRPRGWCNTLCDDNHELLPHHLQEVTLVVFPPSKCQK